jgi:molybdenum cofactor biosynthesis enzyme MoaA
MLDDDKAIELGGNGFTSSQIASTLSNRIQQLILLPTERCNFRCTYCYEDFVLGRMSTKYPSRD